MPRLTARGPSGQEARCRLRTDRTVRLGRRPTAPSPDQDAFEVAWEGQLSRDHADLRWGHGVLEVVKLPGAKNPLFYDGREQSTFTMDVGDHFVVGETNFLLAEDRLAAGTDEAAPLDLVGHTLAEMAETRYADADQRVQVLSTLPEVIRGAASDDDLFARLSVMLFASMARATAVAFVRVMHGRTVEVLHWETQHAADAEFKPSRRLILDAVEHRKQSVSTRWGAASTHQAEYTVADTSGWAFCTPIPGTSCSGWGIYVSGIAESAAFDLRPDVKFTDLMANLVGAMKDFRSLQRQQDALGRFFSPVALPMLASPDGERALEPRQTEVTVLFCDLRGFSAESEKSRDDLMDLLKRVSRALDVMTKCIHARHGVIGDFQGDAALAFWGWPMGDGRHAAEACRAAVDIRLRFAKAAEDLTDTLSGFRCGIGIATGEAVAGRLGTSGQFKIDVFGPVVNLASRLEGITKQLSVPILVDELTVTRALAAGAGDDFRFRRLARLRPYGMATALTASELLPPGGETKILDVAGVSLYERALDAFTAGRWDEAFNLLHEVPPWDHGKDFLTSHILQHRRQPPAGWDGVIALDSK
jgi:adenylate cyclase